MIAYRRCHDGRTTAAGLFGHHVGTDAVVGRIEMAHRLVEQNEVGRLRHGADYSHALLLSDRHVSDWRVDAVGYAEAFESIFDPSRGSPSGEGAFDFDVFTCRKLGEEHHLLWKPCYSPTPDCGPA